MAEETNNNAQDEDIDYLSMSDDELADLVEPSVLAEEDSKETETTVNIEEKKEETVTTSTDDTKENAEESTENATGAEETIATESLELNFADEYKKLTAPFKANGKEMQVKSVDEARTLMMMGANYNKKMAGLKPSLRILKTLENNGLLDEDKLNYLIDLDKKTPSAINKLIKDSGINPLDLDVEEATDYKPNTYAASNKEVELDAVLDDIRDTPAFKDTIDIISNKWDDSSRRVLVDNPAIIKAINDHVSAGIYDQITTRVERERMLGRLNGVSDIEAYKQIGDAMQASGEFSPKPATRSEQSTPVQQKASNIDKKKAASSTVKVGKTTKPNQEFNPLALSDEEFAKLAESTFS